MTRLLKIFTAGLVLTLLAPLVATADDLDVSEKLQRAHSLLISNPKVSRQLLADVEKNQERLSKAEQEKLLLYKSHILLLDGNYDLAIQSLDLLLASTGDNNIRAQAYAMLGVNYANRSEFVAAFINIEKARQLLKDLTSERAIKTVLANAATIYTKVGFVDKAYELSRSYLKEVGKQNTPKEQCYAYYNAGIIDLQLEKYIQAKENFSRSVKFCQQSEQTLFHILSQQELAFLEAKQTQGKNAITKLQSLQEQLEDYQWEIGSASGLLKIAETNLLLKDFNQAIDYAEQVYAISSKHHSLPMKKEAAKLLASSYSSLGDKEKAVEYYKVYVETQKEIELQLKQRKMAFYIAMQDMGK